MKNRRRVYDIKNDLDNLSNSINNNKKYILFSIIADIILSILYYIFVVGKGTKFDHSVSILVLSFFVIICMYIKYF